MQAAESYTPGDPAEPTTRLGPLASAGQRDRVRDYIKKGIKEGAKLLTGGVEPPEGLEKGYFVRPTVFSDVRNDMTIAQEEIFGPVLSIIPYDDEDEAIRIANDTIYGLNASVFTNDPDRAYAVARRLQAGTVGHNTQRADYSLAFGGFKQSGVGREGGREGLMTYLETKAVILDAEPSAAVGVDPR